MVTGTAHHGLGLNDAEGFIPLRPDPGEGGPEGSIKRRQFRLCLLVSVRGELLTQGQLDRRLLATASEEGADSRKDDRHVHGQDSDHAAILCEGAVDYQADNESRAGMPSTVDRLVAE